MSNPTKARELAAAALDTIDNDLQPGHEWMEEFELWLFRAIAAALAAEREAVERELERLQRARANLINKDVCPDCGERIEYDEVDIGVGVMRGNPGCPECGWLPHLESDFEAALDALAPSGEEGR